MTRLVDLNDDRHTYCGDCGEYEMWSIDPDVPVVDAIPVEWIRKYTEENRLYQSDDFDIYINDMISDWWAEGKDNE